MTNTHTYISGATLTREGCTLILREEDGREIDRHTFPAVTTALAWFLDEVIK